MSESKHGGFAHRTAVQYFIACGGPLTFESVRALALTPLSWVDQGYARWLCIEGPRLNIDPSMPLSLVAIDYLDAISMASVKADSLAHDLGVSEALVEYAIDVYHGRGCDRVGAACSHYNQAREMRRVGLTRGQQAAAALVECATLGSVERVLRAAFDAWCAVMSSGALAGRYDSAEISMMESDAIADELLARFEAEYGEAGLDRIEAGCGDLMEHVIDHYLMED